YSGAVFTRNGTGAMSPARRRVMYSVGLRRTRFRSQLRLSTVKFGRGASPRAVVSVCQVPSNKWTRLCTVAINSETCRDRRLERRGEPPCQLTTTKGEARAD